MNDSQFDSGEILSRTARFYQEQLQKLISTSFQIEKS